LIQQIEPIKEMIGTGLNIPVLQDTNKDADELIVQYTNAANKASLEVIIMTDDRR
jgi:hypothetical protein